MAYDKKQVGRSELVEEMRRDYLDEPEQTYKGMAGGKTRGDKYEDLIEDMEMDEFRRVNWTKDEKKAMNKKKDKDFN